MKGTYIPAAILSVLGVCLLLFVASYFLDRGAKLSDLVPFVPAVLSFLGSVVVAVLTASTARQTEELKTKLGQQSKAIEAAITAIIPKKHEGYHDMWRAASEYFRALQSLQVGIYDEAALRNAETSCLVAIGKSLLIPEEDDLLFQTFWQASVFIRENAEAVIKTVLNPHGYTQPEEITDPLQKSEQNKRLEVALIAYWGRVGKQYGRQLSVFRIELQKRLEAAMPKIPEDVRIILANK